MKRFFTFSLVVAACALVACSGGNARRSRNLDRAKATLDSIYKYYGVAGSGLLRENYPFNADYKAGYLASEEQARPNPYSYLWPFSGTLSAVNAILEADASYRSVLDNRVLGGLAEYLDTAREPVAYASYINSAPASDRFYDDNVWLGIDFCDIYEATGDRKYLAEAEMIWKFIESGTDDVLGGGIYWCEQKKYSKNTCSNAPGAVYALKLYAATGSTDYLDQGKTLYAWTKERLLDTEDGLYFDNVGLDGRIGRAKFAYNSGQMVQAGALLYKATGDKSYLEDAQRTAAACYDRFFVQFMPEEGGMFRIICKGNIWFSAVMVRGLIELYRIDGNATYVDAVQRSLDYAWIHSRDGRGLFETDFTGHDKQAEKWLLTQGAMVEMFARMSTVDLK
ncbi:glycoside hydrolase family 76 protein [uncultured Alistipes sp.]|jgi:hypothetical protein|uniref:glycoside hydrolase family 76 protein n=1 Tax=uncultured Alistipes sp. TaxID=538949 RepID=UPI0025F407A5|nr:glycoside hydrolase family 76 protein [uncultured Alistipes sp.]